MDTTARIFKRARRRLHLTLEQVARLTGQALPTVKRWSRGLRPVPRYVLRLLAAERLRRYQAKKIARAIEGLKQIQAAAPFDATGWQAGALLLQLNA